MTINFSCSHFFSLKTNFIKLNTENKLSIFHQNKMIAIVQGYFFFINNDQIY